MDLDALPATGTCELTTTGRRSGKPRRIEIWYVIMDGAVHIVGTPGPRSWLANLRANRHATLHLRGPARDVPVVTTEVTRPTQRLELATRAWIERPAYRDYGFTEDEWVRGSPMVRLTPSTCPPS